MLPFFCPGLNINYFCSFTPQRSDMNTTSKIFLSLIAIGSIYTGSKIIIRLNQLNKAYFNYKGLSYCWGGSSPGTGFDCSGFASYIYNNYLNIPNNRTTAQQMANNSKKVFIPIPGDLVFFKDNLGNINHVGIYINSKKMLHSGGNSGVSYADFTSPYWQNKYSFIGRLN